MGLGSHGSGLNLITLQVSKIIAKMYILLFLSLRTVNSIHCGQGKEYGDLRHFITWSPYGCCLEEGLGVALLKEV